MKIKCPNCGSTTWKALEQVQAATECEIVIDDEIGIEIIMNGSTEFIRDMATSVTVAYTCADEGCGYTTAPENLGSLKEEPRVQQNFDNPESLETLRSLGARWPEGKPPVGKLAGHDQSDHAYEPDPADIAGNELHTWTPEHGLAVGGLISAEGFVKMDVLVPISQGGPMLPDEPIIDDEPDTEGHKAAAAENLERAQEMRAAREADKDRQTSAETYKDKLARVFGG